MFSYLWEAMVPTSSATAAGNTQDRTTFGTIDEHSNANEANARDNGSAGAKVQDSDVEMIDASADNESNIGNEADAAAEEAADATDVDIDIERLWAEAEQRAMTELAARIVATSTTAGVAVPSAADGQVVPAFPTTIATTDDDDDDTDAVEYDDTHSKARIVSPPTKTDTDPRKRKRKRSVPSSSTSSSSTVPNSTEEHELIQSASRALLNLPLRSALLRTRCELHRLFQTSGCRGVILIDANPTTDRTRVATTSMCSGMGDMGGMGYLGGKRLLVLQFHGVQPHPAHRCCDLPTMEVEYAVTDSLKRAERFLRCDSGGSGAHGFVSGDSGVCDNSCPRLLIPHIVFGTLWEMLRNQTHSRLRRESGNGDVSTMSSPMSCLESGLKVYEGVLP